MTHCDTIVSPLVIRFSGQQMRTGGVTFLFLKKTKFNPGNSKCSLFSHAIWQHLELPDAFKSSSNNYIYETKKVKLFSLFCLSAKKSSCKTTGLFMLKIGRHEI
jgi:hypothetical protein